jgi:pyrroline-5-carboxylate reductase
MLMQTIGIIGCGNMGSAVARAMAVSEQLDLSIMLYDADANASAVLAAEISAVIAASIEELQDTSDMIMLAVKPQILPELYDLLSRRKDMKYISIAAGVAIETISLRTGSSEVVRFMPNIAASVSQAVTSVSYGDSCTAEFKETAFAIASCFGVAVELRESLIPAFIGISGSAIAYFYQFLHAVALGGTKEGIPYNQAVKIASHTFGGAVGLLEASGEQPVSLMTNVLSAGGTTIAGIHELERGFTADVMNAVHASALRATDLEQAAKEQP